MTVPASRPHYIYRHFSSDGELLYVGVTCNPKERPFARRDRPWLDETVRVDITAAMSMWDAYRAEYVALRDENPSCNTQRSNAWLRWYAEAEERAFTQWTAEEHDQAMSCALERAFPHLGRSGPGPWDSPVEAHATCAEIFFASRRAWNTGEVLPRTHFEQAAA